MRPLPVILVCVGLLVVGVAIGVVGVNRIIAVDDRIATYPIVEPGESTRLDLRGGDQVAFYEAPCFDCGGRRGPATAPSLRVRGPLDSVGPVEVTPYGDSPRYRPHDLLNYSSDGYEGSPVYDIDKTTDGLYEVAVGRSSEPGTRMRIGLGLEGRAIGGFVIAVGGFLVAGIALLVPAAWGVAILLRQASQ